MADRCITTDCDNFGNPGNEGLCNACANSWARPETKEERKAKVQKLNPIEPIEDDPKPEHISEEQYLNFTPQERAQLSQTQLEQVCKTVVGNNVYASSCRQLRSAIENKLSIKQTCECGCTSFLNVSSRACDGNYWVLPSGTQGQGYLPCFSGIYMSGGDGTDLDLCTDCGRVFGFNKAELSRQIYQSEQDQLDEF